MKATGEANNLILVDKSLFSEETVRPSTVVLHFKIHDTFFHLENLLSKLIVHFRAMKDICVAPYILA